MTEKLTYIKGVTFGWMAKRGELNSMAAKRSLRKMVQETGANTMILAVSAVQETAYSEKIDYTSSYTVSDEEIISSINVARELGLKVILKPIVNCQDGTWRAHINFFDIDVPCEPKWKNWFESYTDYLIHYAKLAEETACEMLIIGCEMVQAQRREEEWRELIKQIRSVYHGLISYNTDKYQEGEVKWWDAVDVISSSGYYPIDDWDKQLERIKQIVLQFNKPFFFAEAGCMSVKGSANVPNDWGIKGETSLEEQKRYYEMMFEKCRQETWVRGFGIWDWEAHLYPKATAVGNRGYAIYGKPSCEVVKRFFTEYIE